MTRHDMQAWLAGALAREPRTVLLVTHDVEEALMLGDRVAMHVAAPRPRRRRSSPCPLPRPRSRTDAELVALRARALEALR